MTQQQIIDLLNKKGRLFATEIINELREGSETKEFVRNVLKQMRKYGEVNFIEVGICQIDNSCRTFNVENSKGVKQIIKDELLYAQFPELRGKKITRSCYLYFLK